MDDIENVKSCDDTSQCASPIPLQHDVSVTSSLDLDASLRITEVTSPTEMINDRQPLVREDSNESKKTHVDMTSPDIWGQEDKLTGGLEIVELDDDTIKEDVEEEEDDDDVEVDKEVRMMMSSESFELSVDKRDAKLKLSDIIEQMEESGDEFSVGKEEKSFKKMCFEEKRESSMSVDKKSVGVGEDVFDGKATSYSKMSFEEESKDVTNVDKKSVGVVDKIEDVFRGFVDGKATSYSKMSFEEKTENVNVDVDKIETALRDAGCGDAKLYSKMSFEETTERITDVDEKSVGLADRIEDVFRDAIGEGKFHSKMSFEEKGVTNVDKKSVDVVDKAENVFRVVVDGKAKSCSKMSSAEEAKDVSNVVESKISFVDKSQDIVRDAGGIKGKFFAKVSYEETKEYDVEVADESEIASSTFVEQRSVSDGTEKLTNVDQSPVETSKTRFFKEESRTEDLANVDKKEMSFKSSDFVEQRNFSSGTEKLTSVESPTGNSKSRFFMEESEKTDSVNVDLEEIKLKLSSLSKRVEELVDDEEKATEAFSKKIFFKDDKEETESTNIDKMEFGLKMSEKVSGIVDEVTSPRKLRKRISFEDDTKVDTKETNSKVSNFVENGEKSRKKFLFKEESDEKESWEDTYEVSNKIGFAINKEKYEEKVEEFVSSSNKDDIRESSRSFRHADDVENIFQRSKRELDDILDMSTTRVGLDDFKMKKLSIHELSSSEEDIVDKSRHRFKPDESTSNFFDVKKCSKVEDIFEKSKREMDDFFEDMKQTCDDFDKDFDNRKLDFDSGFDSDLKFKLKFKNDDQQKLDKFSEEKFENDRNIRDMKRRWKKEVERDEKEILNDMGLGWPPTKGLWIESSEFSSDSSDSLGLNDRIRLKIKEKNEELARADIVKSEQADDDTSKLDDDSINDVSSVDGFEDKNQDDSLPLDHHPVKMSITRSYESHSYSKSADYFEQSFEYNETNTGHDREVNKAKTVISFNESFDDDSKSEPVYDLYVAIADFNSSDEDMIPLWEGQIVEVLDSHSSQKWLVRTRPTKTSSGKQGWVPPSYLEKKTMSSTLRSIQEILEMEADSKTDSVEREAHKKRNQVVKELIETEEEFARDMMHVVKTYLRDLDNPRVPKEIRDLRDVIFMNFEKICDFHNNILMKGVQYYASEPSKLGRTFLRLERDFDMHVNYCRDIEQAQLVLSTSPAKEYFAQYSQRIGEVGKTLHNHLKLPIQRINDYQLLLKELIKYSARLKEDCSDLQKALDLMLSIPQRAQDLEYINSIEGYKGNLLKLGRLLRHDWFTVSDNHGHVKERYLFIFKSRILVTKVHRINEDRSIFVLKDIIRLPEVEVKESAVDKCRFELIHKEGLPNYPLTLLAKTEFIREAWLKEIKEFSDEVVDLGEDEIRVDSEEGSQEVPSVVLTETATQNHVTQEESAKPEAQSAMEGFLEEPKEDSRPTTPGGTLVPHAPHFSMKLKDTEMTEDSSFRFMVKVRAHPEAQVKFLKDDKALVFDDRVKLITEDVETFELIINHVTQEDAGKYSCTAKNAEGEATTEGNVTVTANRYVFMGIEDGVPVEGTMNGGEDVDFKWYRDGQEFEASERFKVMYKDEEDTLALVFQHVKPEDAGLYTCVASTASGNIACSAELTVQGAVNQLAREPQKPEITAELTDTEVSSGGSAMLELKVSGFPKPKVKWFHDGEEVVAGGRFRFLHEDEESIALVIKNVTKEDSGKYKVVAKNEIGEAVTSATLTVKAPPKFRSQMKDISIMMDELVRFEVEIEGKPTPDISWYKDGRPVVATGRVQTVHETEESFALIIKKVQPDDAGNYSCMASNTSGKISEFCELKVNAPPSFVKELKMIECRETETIKYEVKVAGSPMPKITWSANGEEIKYDGKKFKAEEDEKNFTLTVDSVTRKDAGKFTCTLTNEYGSVSSSADLVVNCTPQFEQRLKDVTVKEGDVDAQFDVKLSGTPSPKLRWFIDGMEIDESKKNFKTAEDGDTHTLIIKKVGPDVAGKLTVKATNSAGEISCSGVVTVLAKPKFTEELSDKEVTEGETVTYTVKATGYPKPDVKWYKDNGEVTVDANIKITHDSVETWTMTLNCVAANSAGKYECRANNSEGEAKTSSKLIVNILVKTEEITETDLTLNLGKDDEKGYEEDSNEGTVLIEPEDKEKVESDTEKDKEKEESAVDEEEPPKKDDRKYSDEGCWWLEEEEVVVTSVTHKLKTDEDVDVEEDDVEIPQMTVEGNLRKLRQDELGGPNRAEIEGGVIIEEVTSPEILEDGEAKPNFEQGLSDVDAWLGLQAILEVKVHGIPEVEVKWTKDGKPLANSDKVKIESDGDIKRLIIKETEKGDSGNYKVLIKNKIGETSSEAKLQVKTPGDAKAPVFTHPLKDASCILGNSMTFEVTALGNPSPLVKWMKDGVEITENDKYHFEHTTGEFLYKVTIDKCEESDKGKYCIFAENEDGEASSEASLEIKIPPEVETPTDQSVLPKGSTKFETKVTGNPQPKVSWTRNGKVLEEGKKFKTTSDAEKGIYALIMTEVDIEDGGEYEVVAENDAGTKKASFKLNFTTAEPKFTKPLTSTTAVKPTTSVQLDVEVDGIPIPDVTWHFEGAELTSNEHVTLKQNNEKSHSLIIDKFEETDAGEITCKAKSAVGEAVSKGKLIVKHEKPTFTKHLPKETCAIDGDAFSLEAKIDGSPQPAITWLKDGKEIVPSERVKIETLPDGTTRLKVDNAKPADCGKYSVVAKNETGEQVSTGAVSVEAVPKPPVIIGELKKTNVIEGKPLVLEVKVSGHPKPTVKWFKDGKPIKADRVKITEAPDGTVTLTIDNAVPEDAGKYSVQVSNPLGESSSAADVTVQSPQQAPEFGVALKGCQAYEGFPIRLEGKVKGHPKPEIQWVKDGEKIVPDGERIVETTLPDGTFALVVNNAKPEDAGKYSCVATNPEGKAESSAEVEVKARAKPDEATCEPSFITPLRDVTVDEGTPLKLQAHITSNPLPDMTWTKDGQTLSPTDPRVQISFDGDRVGLEIKKATPADAGKYECSLTNPHGTSASAADIQVKKLSKAPFFTQRFPDLDTILGQDARFMCRIAGLPTPDISWAFNDKPIFDSDKYKLKREGDMHALYVKNCTPDDIGNIHCTARNPEGEDKCAAFLNVSSKLDKKTKTEPPSFLKRLADCDVIEGMPGKFTACISGYPEPDYKWYKDGKELYPSDRIKIEVEPHGLLRLLIKDIKPLDVGKYTLKITNDHGAAESDAHLRCEGFDVKKKRPMLDLNIEYDKMKKTGMPLALPGKPIISKMTDRRLTLSWNPSIPIGPRVPVTYIVEMSEVLPDAEWLSIRTGIRGGCCEIKNLEPYQDYKFRIRVENKYGISDPSPYATAYRTKLEMTPPRILPRLPPEFDFRPETSPYFPKDWDFDRPLHEQYAHAPRFMRQETEAQYGIRNQPSSITWYVYGFPVPTVSWYFNDEKIEVHGRYESSFSRNGQTTLYINRFLDRDVGIYECVAINEHGEARQRVRMDISDPPVFSSHLDETTIMIRESGVLECRLVGVPYPEVKWYKDWHPIVSTDRIKIEWREPDLCTLTIKNAISKDGGLYSCAARNVAGMTSCSAMLTIEESESDYSILSYNRNRVIKARQNKQFEDFYDIGDELGRGTQGTIYHTVERSTGNSYAAKIMHGKGDYRSYMDHELDVMNQFHDRRLIRGIDAFDTKKGLTLVTELASGGLLLDSLCRQSTLSESEIAFYVRQMLWGLEHMHTKGYAHLGLTVGDILLARPGGDDIKITDFGLTRRLVMTETYYLDYGMPEFVAPEIANRQRISFYTDMWSVGVITYIFLSGISPFLGEHDRQTLEQVQQGRLNFDTDVFSHISDEAKDFMLKLLVFDQYGRMDVKMALKHPWLRCADRLGYGERYSTDRLNNYYRRYRDWVSRSGCRRFYRRRPLSSAFTHPSRMVYPPDEDYTPPSSPEVELTPKGGGGIQWDRPTFSDKVDREHEDINYDLGYIDSESKYQNGPDTYLLQLRDVGLPLRLREYMRVAGVSSPSLGLRMLDTMLGKNVTIHERRRFTDIMDEEIDDEKKGITDSVRKRITSEVSPRSETKNRLRELLPQKAEDGDIPYFREKIKDIAFVDEENVELSCYAVGIPKPIVQWYRNDIILSETHRIKFIETPEGRSILRFSPVKPFDAGVFKAIARNTEGDTNCRARLRLGDIPGRMEAPEVSQVSSDQALVVWGPPKETGNAAITEYELEYKEIDANDWISACKNVDHEFFIVHGLQPRTSYHFRCKAANKFGRGEFSVPSAGAVTNEVGGEPLTVSKAMAHQQQMSERRTSRLEGEETDISSDEPKLDYSNEENGIELSTNNPNDKYNFVSELSKGKFSVVMKCCQRDENNDRLFAAKFIDCSSANEESAKREYDVMSTLRHESIACLHSAFLNNGKYVLIMDKLHGYDVLTYLTSRHQYNEDLVVKIVSQLLDALQYLHFRNVAHLDIQPDNVVLKSLQLAQVKLVDFGSAQKIPRTGSVCLDIQPGDLDYRAPEVISNGDVGFQADVWSVGVLAYVLLSGSVPYAGNDEAETKENILYVRYRFENLFKEITQESTRFLMQIFKKTPFKRLTVDECLEHKWLNPSEYMLRKRERAVFLSSRLQEYADAYHENRLQEPNQSSNLAKSSRANVKRVASVEETEPTRANVERLASVEDTESTRANVERLASVEETEPTRANVERLASVEETEPTRANVERLASVEETEPTGVYVERSVSVEETKTTDSD